MLPRAGKLQMQPISTASTAALLREYSDRSDIRYVGNDNNEIRQVREYRTGDAMRHIHWNQSARTGKLWYKEFEREEEDSCEILLDMTIPEKWQPEQRDGFYEVLSAVLSGLLRSGYRVIISWYDEKTAGFVGAAVEDNTDYHSMMRKLYQSEFVGKADAVERAYAEKKTSARNKMYRWNLCLEWYEIKDSGKEELRHRFTYEKLEQELCLLMIVMLMLGPVLGIASSYRAEEILRILAVMVVYTLVLTPLFIKYRRLRRNFQRSGRMI